jgi:hypothetical protein
MATLEPQKPQSLEVREENGDKPTKRSFPTTSELDRIRFITPRGLTLFIGSGAWGEPENPGERGTDEPEE